ncbi:MAG: hypothetical protein K0V04_21025 [Deltaproteobacteria bacterium]|nr:hypothetical protein [Deltaproteobacteria bacterium]
MVKGSIVAAIVAAASIAAPAPDPQAQPPFGLEQPPFELEWFAPPPCPSQAVVSSRIEHALATSVQPGAPTVRARGRIQAKDDGWELTLLIADVTGDRKVYARRCDELADAAVFIISVAIDPTLMGGPEPSPPPVVHTPEPEPQPEPEPVPAVTTPEPPSESEITWLGRIDAGPDSGAMPGVGGHLGVGLGLQRRHLRLEAGGRMRLPQTLRLSSHPTARARFTLGHADVRACAVVFAGRVEFPLCGAVELGAIRATGIGVERGTTAHRLWSGAGVSPGVVVPWGRFALRAGFDVTALLVRPRFSIDGGGLVHRLGLVQARGFIGIEFRQPPTKRGPRGKRRGGE